MTLKGTNVAEDDTGTGTPAAERATTMSLPCLFDSYCCWLC